MPAPPPRDLPLVDRRPRAPGRRGVPPVEVDRERGRVLVLQIELPLRGDAHPRVPRPEKFTHFALDRRTSEILEKLATAVRLGEPCLLEGETSTSKTSSIEYLALVTGNPVMRLNLSGQTDTAELVGKYVPHDGSLRTSFDALLADAALLRPETQAILERARAEGRTLTLVESQRVATAEGLLVPAWRWQDGAVPEAMTTGCWLILDEVNLAETAVLERLNPVLERHPSLTLSEGGGERIGAGGDRPLHPGFRIFATMNPAESSGRSPLSPAYKDRFTAYKFVATPTDTEYAEMLTLLVFGEQPRFTRDGVEYAAAPVPPLHPSLSRVGHVRGFLAKLSKVHATLEGLARRREIGRESRERLVFTRRTIIELLSYLDRVEVVDRVSGQALRFEDDPKGTALRAMRYFYLDRIARDEDLRKVEDVLEAVGLSERQWTHAFGAPPVPTSAASVPARPAGDPASAPASTGEAIPRPVGAHLGSRILPNVFGGTLLVLQGEAGGFSPGQRLTLREGAGLPEAVRAGSRFEVIGVGPDGKVVVQVDGGPCLKASAEKVAERFDRT